MDKILDSITDQKEIRFLTKENEEQLCKEVREEIVESVSKNGGHLASNLGVVELSVALLSVFDLEKDTIIWDVGHQCYTHKILTGRKERFSTVRANDGLSGFPSREESDFDPFTTGHSSASISSALGIAIGKQIKEKSGYTVAVIGDGALTGGLAFEGLNNAGRRRKNFIVIINDNNMSISKNVGSMAKYLTYMRSSQGYIKAKSSVERTLGKIPLVGNSFANGLRKAKGAVRRIVYKSNIFEDMGFKYYGIFDGHDLTLLKETLENVKKINKPVVIHLRTTKGKGYQFAEEKPWVFHGVAPFNNKTGEVPCPKKSFSDVFGNCLVNIAEQNKKICAITAAMSTGTGLLEFSKKYKDRFFDVGIAEAHAVTFAAGLARQGLLPVFAVYSTFLQRAYDSLVHDIALQNLKVVLAVDRAGMVGEDGKTHQGLFDVSFLRTVPNITIFSPSYFDELDFTLQRIVEDDFNLVAVRYPRGGQMYRPDDFVSKFMDFDIYGDENAKVAIVTYGRVFSNCCEALEKLKAANKSAVIYKLNKIFPIEEEVFEKLKAYDSVLFVEEGQLNGGINEYVSLNLQQRGYKGKYSVSAVKNPFVTHNSMGIQMEKNGLDAQSIANVLKNLC